LWIHQGSAAQGIAALQEHYAISAVYCAEEVSWEEKAEEEEIAKLGLPLKRFWQYSLYSREDLPMALGDIPGVFTAFRKKMEKYSQVREPLPAPEKISSPPIQGAGEIPSLADPGHEQAPTDKRAVLPFKGGSEAALQRLNRYFWEEDRLRDYKNTRNGLIGQAYSSKFSPWLAQGCISPRQIYAEIKAYEEERVQNSFHLLALF
jgi:Deoxyribodipyrimidine photolyase